MSNIEALYKKFNNFNKGKLNERIKANEPIEKWILHNINHYGINFNGHVLNDWKKSNLEDDKIKKIDFYHISGNNTYYAQAKFRQPNSGNDLLLALIQPYYGLKEVKGDKTKWGRDYKFDGDLYFSLDNSWEYLRIVPYKLIKPKIKELLKDWCESGEELSYTNRIFNSTRHKGLVLQWKRDSGRKGFDAGVEKVLCFMPIEIFKKEEIQILTMID